MAPYFFSLTNTQMPMHTRFLSQSCIFMYLLSLISTCRSYSVTMQMQRFSTQSTLVHFYALIWTFASFVTQILSIKLKSFYIFLQNKECKHRLYDTNIWILTQCSFSLIYKFNVWPIVVYTSSQITKFFYWYKSHVSFSMVPQTGEQRLQMFRII